MTNIIRAPAADDDLLAIGLYGASEWGADRAQAFVGSFEEAFSLLSRHPDIGRERPDVGQGIQSWLHRSYVIYYRHCDEEVVIGRVLHGSAEPKSPLTFGELQD